MITNANKYALVFSVLKITKVPTPRPDPNPIHTFDSAEPGIFLKIQSMPLISSLFPNPFASKIQSNPFLPLPLVFILFYFTSLYK